MENAKVSHTGSKGMPILGVTLDISELVLISNLLRMEINRDLSSLEQHIADHTGSEQAADACQALADERQRLLLMTEYLIEIDNCRIILEGEYESYVASKLTAAIEEQVATNKTFDEIVADLGDL